MCRMFAQFLVIVMALSSMLCVWTQCITAARKYMEKESISCSACSFRTFQASGTELIRLHCAFGIMDMLDMGAV